MAFFHKFREDLSIKYKLLGIMAPCFLGLVCLSAIQIAQRRAQADEMTLIESYTALAMNINSSVHELQKERGLTSVFLASKGLKMGQELEAQRKNADKELAEFDKKIEPLKAVGLAKQAAAAKETLGKLDEIRRSSTALALTVPEAVEYYSRLNNQLISIMGAMPNLIGDSVVSNKFVGFYAAQNFKEPMGIERAVLAGAFANNKFAPGMYRRLLEAVNTQEANKKFYYTVMSDENVRPFDEFVQSDVAKKTLELREIALNKGEAGDFGVDSNDWIKLQTEKINLFNDTVITKTIARDILAVTDEKFKEAGSALIWTVAISSGILLMAAFLSFSITRGILRTVGETTRVVGEISRGDFTQRVAVEGRDEVGMLGSAVNEMVSDLRTMFREISASSVTLAASAEELSIVSSRFAESSNEISSQTSGVAEATEKMSGNISSLAAGVEETSVNATTVSSTAEQMSANMRTIAGAIEVMSASIGDVAKNSERTAEIANKAMDFSKTATGTMKDLGMAANEIGKVTEMIKRIAEQTNLLALNATIEAASAGDAGKGFAVVANEIKELANQSARAAEDIADKIGGIQGNTNNAVRVITDVSAIIGNINDAVNVINLAVKKQTSTAEDVFKNVEEMTAGANNIAMSISEVAKATEYMARTAGDAAKGASDVSTKIGGITGAMTENNSGVSQINESSGELAKIAGALQTMVGRFKIETNDRSTDIAPG